MTEPDQELSNTYGPDKKIKKDPPSFSRKYKPYYLDDFFIPDVLKQTIRSLIQHNETNLLLYGEPNTGKTSLIYALVRHYYELSKDEPFPENEVIFINNLKEQQGVSFFRNELKSFCQSRSQQLIVRGKKKMVVIDDLDLINPQCQQVMCNYMDKYGGTILFIYSCLNIQKVVEGIQSRSMVLEIEPPKRFHLENLFYRILTEEKGKNQQVLFMENELETIRDFLIENSNGNPLSLVNCMEKCVVFQGRDGSPISLEICRSLFLERIFQSFKTYLELLQQGDLRGSIQVMYSILQNGYSVVDIFDYFFQYIKICKEIELNETCKYEIVKWLCHYITIVRNVHEENLELALFTNRLFSILQSSSLSPPPSSF